MPLTQIELYLLDQQEKYYNLQIDSTNTEFKLKGHTLSVPSIVNLMTTVTIQDKDQI